MLFTDFTAFNTTSPLTGATPSTDSTTVIVTAPSVGVFPFMDVTTPAKFPTLSPLCPFIVRIAFNWTFPFASGETWSTLLTVPPPEPPKWSWQYPTVAIAKELVEVSVGWALSFAWFAGALMSIPLGESMPSLSPLAAVIVMNESFAAVPGVLKAMNGVGAFIVNPFLDTDVPLPVNEVSTTSSELPTIVTSF